MLKSRIITAVILLGLFLAALFALPDFAWTGLVVLMVMQGVSEWAKLAKLSERVAKVYWLSSLLLMFLIVWCGAHEAQLAAMLRMLVYGVAALLWLIIAPTWMIASWKVSDKKLTALLGWAVLIPTGLAMLDLRSVSPWLLLFIMGLVWVADIAAYFTGRKFGKNKLAPRISPGKTWEGVAGAMLGVACYVILVWTFAPNIAQHTHLAIALLAAFCWVALAVIGDLFESAIKRQAGVKDSGALLPGHGGLLDRIDALTSTLPLAALALLLQ